MPNDSDESKHDAPGTNVTVSFPALTMSLQASMSDEALSRHWREMWVSKDLRIDLVFRGVRAHAHNPILGLNPDFPPRR